LAKINPMAALAVFFVMVGTGTEMYVALITFGVLPTLSQAVYLAVKDIPKENLYKAMTLGASKAEMIIDIVFMQIIPRIVDVSRLQLGSAMVYLIAAEMICGDVGFGYRIRLQSRLLNMNVVYPYIAFLAMAGFFVDWLLRYYNKKFFPWYTQERRQAC
jgi:NitT/TauT family transport system permease protein